MTRSRATRPTRIARVIARLNVGGPTLHVTWLTADLPRDEFETVLLTGVVPPGEVDMTSFATARGVQPVVIPEMSREISARDAVTLWKLFRFFRRFRPDIVHTHTAKAGAVGRAAGFLYRWLTPGTLVGRPNAVRFVHTYHGHVFHSYYGRLKTRLFLFIERTLGRVTDTIVVLSEQQREEVHATFGVGRRGQFRIVPLGIDLAALPADDRDEAEGRAFVVGIVGRLTAIKNHDLFLRVAARMSDLPQLQFVVYGDGADREALERKALSLGLSEPRFRFAGTREPRDIYRRLDLSVLTSLNEGTPLSLIESMASGVPIVSTAVGGVVDLAGGVQEHVTDGGGYEVRERGLTCASNDVEGLEAALRRAIADAPLRRAVAQRARAFAVSRYAKERLVADIIALYRELGVSA